jgi:ABC-2 type transport system permease protein
MSALAGSARSPAPVAAPRVRHGMRDVYVTELQKLSAQLATRLLALICLLGPLAFAALLKIQSGTPSDALFGVWVHASGFAISLVVLGFAGSWGFPLIAGVLAGDMFASEDRYGTWKTILTRSSTRAETFAGKLLAAGSLTLVLTVVTAVSSLIAGLLLVGGQSLVDLSGAVVSPAHALALVIASWALCLPPVLAYTSLAVLFSVASRNGIVGVLGPILVALVTQLLDLIGKGVIVHLLLIGAAFDGWHGLFTTHPFYGPLLISSVVCSVWIAAALTASWRILARRDFLGNATTRSANWRTPIRFVAIATVVIAVLALACNLGPAGVTSKRLQQTLLPEFTKLTRLQQTEQGHTIPAAARLDIIPNCNRHASKPVGPGDWTCTMDIYILQRGHIPLTQTPVEYDVSVEYNGCYKAQSPPAFVGGQTIRGSGGQNVVNPLFVVYGCFNVL